MLKNCDTAALGEHFQVSNYFIIVDVFDTHRLRVTVAVVRDRKIRTALRPNQISGYVTVPSCIVIGYGTVNHNLNHDVDFMKYHALRWLKGTATHTTNLTSRCLVLQQHSRLLFDVICEF